MLNATLESPAPPENFTKLLAVNITINSTTVNSVLTEIPFNCSLDATMLKPYILRNSTWVAIQNFTIDRQACSMFFVVPKDPVVAIMQAVSAPSTTTVTPVTPPSAPASWPRLAAALAVAIVVLAAIALYLRRRSRKTRPS